MHNYSVTDKKRPKHVYYTLDYQNPGLHLKKLTYGEQERVYLNIEGFINDIEKAFYIYKEKLLSDEKIQRVAIAQYDEFGILVHIELQVWR